MAKYLHNAAWIASFIVLCAAWSYEAPFDAVKPSSRACCAAAIAGESFTSLTAARAAKQGVIIAKALT